MPIEPPEPPEPGEPPDPDVPETLAWEECSSPHFYPQFFEAGEHRFEVRATDFAQNQDVTPRSTSGPSRPTPPDEGPDAVAAEHHHPRVPERPVRQQHGDVRVQRQRRPDHRHRPALRVPARRRARSPTCTSPQEVTGLTPGAHTFAVRAIDLAGNADPTPATHTWTYAPPGPDTTAPDTTIDEHPDAVTVSTDATFRFSSTETGSTFECSLDGAPWSPCTSPIDADRPDASRSHTLEVRRRRRRPATPTRRRPASRGPSAPAPVETAAYCGQVITESIVLTNDLLDCLVFGLIVGAPNITIDLGGYTVDGTRPRHGRPQPGLRQRHRSPTARSPASTSASSSRPGTTGNILDNLDLELNQLAGIAMFDADDGVNGNTLRYNDIAGNDLGIFVGKGTRGTHIHHNVVGANSGDGVRIDHSSHTLVEHNEIIGSSGGGVQMVGASDNRVLDNELSRATRSSPSPASPRSSSPSIPVEIEPPPPPDPVDAPRPSPNNHIEGNTLEGAGIEVSDSNGTQIIGNAIHEAGSGDRPVQRPQRADQAQRGHAQLQRHRADRLAQQPHRVEQRQRDERQRHLAAGAVAEQRRHQQHDQRQQRRHRDRRPGPRRHRHDRGEQHRQQQRGRRDPDLLHRAHDQAQHGQQQRQLGHLRRRRRRRPGQHRRRRQQRHRQRPAGPVLRRALRRLRRPVRAGAAGHVDPARPDRTRRRSSEATFRFTGTDNVSLVHFECSLDGAAYIGLHQPDHVPPASPSAPTRFLVRAIDASGNIDPSPADYTWTRVAVDGCRRRRRSTRRRTTSRSPPTPPSPSPRTSPARRSSAPSTAARWPPCTSPATYTGLAVGPHTFEVAAAGDPSTRQPQLDDRRGARLRRRRLRPDPDPEHPTDQRHRRVPRPRPGHRRARTSPSTSTATASTAWARAPASSTRATTA